MRVIRLAADLYKRALAAFPIATEPGSFLGEASPRQLQRVYEMPTLRNVSWQLVTSNQYTEEEYISWCNGLNTAPQLNRKQWEWVYILEVLNKQGVLKEGSKGLGFGCGKEPLSAIMAKQGCIVLATDLCDSEAAKQGWIEGNQHASRLEDLNLNNLCDPVKFANNVRFRYCDMNNIPQDLRGFDFLWSSCAFEHLGTLEHGLKFVEKSLDCLRSGGVAVHTTEFNLGSNDKTLTGGSACIYRKKDIEGLATRLIDSGHDIGALNFTAGNEAPDLYVDLPPYKSPVHLRLLLKRHLTTSIGLFIRKR